VAKVPYCLGKNMSCGRYRKCSGARKTEKLKDVIYGPPEFIQPGNKTLVNNLGSLVTLSKQAHGLWNVGSFALKHIRGGSLEGTKEMVLELEWLSEHPELTSERGPNLVHADQIVEERSIFRASGSVETEELLHSGYQVTLMTIIQEPVATTNLLTVTQEVDDFSGHPLASSESYQLTFPELNDLMNS
jgi:hypothetical protein